MKIVNLIKKVTAFLCVALILSVSGVFASWYYSEKNAPDVTAHIKLDVFPWAGSDILPDDVEGEHHKILISTVLDGVIIDENGNEVNIGLNNPDSYLSQEIASRSQGGWFQTDTLGSMDFWERNDIANYFGLDTSNLTFVIYFPEGVSDTYYLYTTSVVLGEQNAPNIDIGEIIYPIYRTVLVKNSEGVYEAQITEEGYARSAYYSNPITGSIFVKYPSFDPESWSAGERGKDKSTAINSYLGQSQTVVLGEVINRWYYIEELTNKTVAVSVSVAGTTVSVYDSNGNLIDVTSGAQNSEGLVFSATQSAYYILVSGSSNTILTIEQV